MAALDSDADDTIALRLLASEHGQQLGESNLTILVAALDAPGVRASQDQFHFAEVSQQRVVGSLCNLVAPLGLPTLNEFPELIIEPAPHDVGLISSDWGSMETIFPAHSGELFGE